MAADEVGLVVKLSFLPWFLGRSLQKKEAVKVPLETKRPLVVHIITGLNRGGAESALFRLLTRESDPSQVHVVSLTDGGTFQPMIEALGIRVACLHMRPGLPSPIKWWSLVRLLKTWRPGVVQTWMYHADFLGGLAARAAGTHVCWGLRNGDLTREHSKRSTRFVAWLCARVSPHIPSRAISCSARARDVHRALGYTVPFEVVHNGLDVTMWTPRPELRAVVRDEFGFSDDAFVLAHAGRNDPQKGHATLARAFNRLHADQPNVRLLLCGKGLLLGDPYFEDLPFTATAREAVVALGARDDLPYVWQAADAFVLPSYAEAFPNVVAEAMANGLPAVVTDVGDAAEIVGETGWVVPVMDDVLLSQSILELVRMPQEERLGLGRAARERVQTQFTLERMSAGFHQVWDEIMAGDGTRCVD